jgi:hypothetical protein
LIAYVKDQLGETEHESARAYLIRDGARAAEAIGDQDEIDFFENLQSE